MMPGGEHVWREVAVVGRERAALLVEWLDELVFLAETEILGPVDTERIELSDHRLVGARSSRQPAASGQGRHVPSASVRALRAWLPCEDGARCLRRRRLAFYRFHQVDEVVWELGASLRCCTSRSRDRLSALDTTRDAKTIISQPHPVRPLHER